jgi:hypothetical protein
MAFPADFYAPPVPPPASVPLNDKAWRDYHAAVARYLAALVAALKG